MPGPEFAALVAAVAEGMGQRPDAIKATPDGLRLHTVDGFIFAFVEDPDHLSLAGVERLAGDPAAARGRLVVLTPGRLPLALGEAVGRFGGSLVEHERFRELLRGLDLGALLGEAPRGPHDRPGPRLLPSARHLDAVMARARTWFEWGVPALSLRFYRQAIGLKPGFLPARLGVGRSLAALGLEEEAMATFRQLLIERPGDVEAQLGEAAVHAAAGRVADELRVYRTVLADHPDRADIRIQLMAAEIDAGRWPEALREIASLLAATPEDPRLRFLHSAALEKTGAVSKGASELQRSRDLGLSESEEASLRGHLGLPDGPPRKAPSPPPRERPKARSSAPAPSRGRKPSGGARATRVPSRKRK